MGCRLTNLTLGGEGLWGHKRPKDVIERGVAKRRGMKMSEEAKQRMRAAWTKERKEKHAAARRKPPKVKRTKEEVNALIAQRQRDAWRRNPQRRIDTSVAAKVHLNKPEARAALARSLRGRKASPSQLRCLAIGWTAPRKPMSAETRARMKQKAIARWALRKTDGAAA